LLAESGASVLDRFKPPTAFLRRAHCHAAPYPSTIKKSKPTASGRKSPADRALYDALETGDYAKWHAYKTNQIEESGQHEVLNWFCLLGAMEALGRKPDKAVFLENWAFVSPVVFAHYHA
jgi:hypothetical protein